MCRKGITPSLRSAIWIISIARNTTKNETNKNTKDTKNENINIGDEYGTLEKVNELQRAWFKVLKDSFPDENDETYSDMPRFGLGKVDMKEVLLCHNYNTNDAIEDVNETSVNTLKRVLIAIYDATSIECCHLIPDITNIFLSHMSESQVFFALKRMVMKKDKDFVTYVPCSKTVRIFYISRKKSKKPLRNITCGVKHSVISCYKNIQGLQRD